MVVNKNTIRLINTEAKKIMYDYNIQERAELFIPVRRHIMIKDPQREFLNGS